jgi:hypothetical protein
VIQLVLPLHECATESVTDPAIAESMTEPLHSVANLATTVQL